MAQQAKTKPCSNGGLSMETNHQTQVLAHLKQGKTLSQAEAIQNFDCYQPLSGQPEVMSPRLGKVITVQNTNKK